MSNPAIVVVSYDRPASLSRLLGSLLRAEYPCQTPLVISIDGGGNREVAKVASEFKWPAGRKEIIEHDARMGLREHVLACGDLSEHYGSVVVLEDDLYVSPLFYRFATQALERYGDDDKMAGISLYSHLWNVNCSRPFVPEDDGTDVYLLQFAQSWGQVWNRRMWSEFRSWYAGNSIHGCSGPDIPDYVAGWPESSWLKYYIAYTVRSKKHFVYPRVSLTTNCGEIGEHATCLSTTFQVPLLWGDKKEFVFPMPESTAVVYDVFFERCGLGEDLQLADDELCVDLYGTKANRAKRRYWVTMERRAYKPLASFGLEMRPHEVNVRLRIPGDDIFLYDTSVETHVAQCRDARTASLKKVFYDVRSLRGRDLLRMTAHQLARAIKRKIRPWRLNHHGREQSFRPTDAHAEM